MTDIALARHKGLVFTSAQRDEAEPFIQRWHYSGSLNASMRYAFTLRTPGGLFGDRGEIVACCCFAIPVNRNAKPGELELIRLARVEPGIDIPLSFLVSKSLRWLTLNATPEWRMVISYADNAHQHHGGIYQATNFLYVGKTDIQVQGFRSLDTGEVIHKRTAYDRYGTSSEKFMRHNANSVPVRGDVKYLYVFPLVRGQKARDELMREFKYEALKFPKPDWPAGIRPDEAVV